MTVFTPWRRLARCAAGAASVLTLAWASLWLSPAAAADDAPLAAAAPASAPTARPAAASGPALGVEPFFRHADIAEAQLSPSGRQLAVTLAVGGRRALGLLDLTGGPPRLLAHYTDRDIREFWWVGDQHLAYNLIDLQAGSADQPSGSGLFAVAVAGQAPARQLVALRNPFVTGAPRPGVQPLAWQHTLLAVPQDGSTEVILGRWVFDAARAVSDVLPLRMDVATGRSRSLAQGTPEGAVSWLFDSRGEPRVAVAYREGRALVHWRGPGDSAWRLLASHPALAMPWRPHSVADDGTLYVTVPEGPDGVAVLKVLDLAQAKPQGEAIVRTPGFDFHGHWVSDWGADAKDGRLGLRAETDASTTVWFNPRLQAWQAAADRLLPGRVNTLTCRRCGGDDPVVLVSSASDRVPGELYLFNPKADEKKAWTLVARARRDIEPRRMATVAFERVPTRDGQQMPLWLTVPAGAQANPPTPRPAVVLVHGGPWSRGGHWQWQGMAQFLASRGYVVIEPEFRGSTGYGARWFKAGFHQWGTAMQDDVADALDWAVAQGWADPKRSCIAGASYGGYAALMGPVRHPGKYRCVVSWVGVTDLGLLFDQSWRSDFTEESVRYSLPVLVGDPVAEAARLADESPVNHARQIQVPVLLAYGALDRRVQLAHGERMRDALTEAGRPPEWVVYAEEGHGWLLEANSFDFARRVERFLAEHLK